MNRLKWKARSSKSSSTSSQVSQEWSFLLWHANVKPSNMSHQTKLAQGGLCRRMPRVSVQVVVDGVSETMAVRKDQTAEDLLRSIVAVRGLDVAPSTLCLRHSISGMWIPDTGKLDTIKEGDFLEVKKKAETGQCTVALAGLNGKLSERALGGQLQAAVFEKYGKSCTVSYSDPLRSMVPLLSRLLGIKGKEELAFKAITVNNSTTLEGAVARYQWFSKWIWMGHINISFSVYTVPEQQFFIAWVEHCK